MKDSGDCKFSRLIRVRGSNMQHNKGDGKAYRIIHGMNLVKQNEKGGEQQKYDVEHCVVCEFWDEDRRFYLTFNTSVDLFSRNCLRRSKFSPMLRWSGFRSLSRKV